MELGVHRHVGAHRAGRGDEQHRLHPVEVRGEQGQDPQGRQGDQQEPDRGNRVKGAVLQHLLQVRLGQVDAHREHGEGRIEPCRGGKAVPEDPRQGQLRREEHKAHRDRYHKRRPDEFLQGEALPQGLPRQPGDPVGPLTDVQKRDEAGGVEDIFPAQGGDHQGDAEKARVGKGRREGPDGIGPEDKMGNEYGNKDQGQGPCHAQQDPGDMLRRPFHQESVDDHRREGNINQDVPQGAAPLPGDLPRLKEQVADAREEEHLQDLFCQDKYHGSAFLYLCCFCIHSRIVRYILSGSLSKWWVSPGRISRSQSK